MEIRSPMDAVELSRIRAIGEKVQQLQKEGRDIIRLISAHRLISLRRRRRLWTVAKRITRPIGA